MPPGNESTKFPEQRVLEIHNYLEDQHTTSE